MEQINPYDLNDIAIMMEGSRFKRTTKVICLDNRMDFNPYDLNEIGELTNPNIVVRGQSKTRKDSTSEEHRSIEKKGIFKAI